MKVIRFEHILPVAVLFSMVFSYVSHVTAFSLPDTGQTKCYQGVSPYTESSCSGTGQDGAYNINPMDYTDNLNGTITDNVTGLMWQKEDDNNMRTFDEAVTYCESLTLGGYSDWRLPSRKELITIVDYSIANPGPAINATYFQNTNAAGYWTSTAYAGSASYAWVVYFTDGNVKHKYKFSTYNNQPQRFDYARCVRVSAAAVGGEQSAPSSSFTDNSNGTVTDNATGLMWQQGEPGFMTWAAALSYCDGLGLGGQSDWRLPNIKELESIADAAKKDPAVEKTFFPNISELYYYLSSTTYAYSTGDAWSVLFSIGQVYYKGKTGAYVRCVRGGQSGTQNNCAASVSSSLAMDIPIITFSNSNYWASLQFNPSDSTLSLANAGIISDASPYSNCTASTLSSDFTLHVPVLTYNGASYWIDLKYNGSTFVVAGGGLN